MKQIINALGKLSSGKRSYRVLMLSLMTAIALPAQTFTTVFSFDGTDGAGAQNISTIAGTTWVFPPTPLPAIQAPFGEIRTVAFDTEGNYYVADPGNNLVLKISPSGILSIVAGGGSNDPGDGGPATSATLDGALSVAVDGAGNLFIVCNDVVQMVNTAGIITTVAGSGWNGLGDGGPATSAELNFPFGAAVDGAGNLYIADTYNSRIRKVSGGIITTIAGNGTPGYSGDGGPATSAELDDPFGVAVDAGGNLYIADTFNNRIRKVSGGIISTVVGNGTLGYSGDKGPALSASLNLPYGVALDLKGNLLIADTANNRIRWVDPAGTITTVAGNGTPGYSGDGGLATSASMAFPLGMAADRNGNVFIADSLNERVRRVAPNGIITTSAGDGGYRYSGDGGPATGAQLDLPKAVVADSAGNLFIADTYNNRIRLVNPAGVITTVAGNGIGFYSGDGGPATSAEINAPLGVAVDNAGNLLIADSFSYRIRKVNQEGVITTAAGNGTSGYSGDGGPATNAELTYPAGIALDNSGNLFIADGNRIRRVNPAEVITTVAGNGTQGYSGDGGPATNAELNSPSAVAVDDAGNLYIADTYNNRIRKVSGGIITTVAGDGTAFGGYSGDGGPATSAQLFRPYGVATDSAGNIFIADADNQRIRLVNSAGIITTVAGNGMFGFLGDGGPATNAELYDPDGVALDSAGNLLIADTVNNRVRRVPGLGAVQSAPTVNAGGVLNSASYTTQGVAPGSIVSIFGTNLAAATAGASAIPLPTTLSDVTSVTFNGIPAGLYFVSQNQINAQLPFNVLQGQNSGTVSIVVTRSGGASAPQSLTVALAFPGIFTTTANGLGQAFAYDNTTAALAAPSGTPIGSFATAPISISSGHALIIACTGLGLVNPSIDNYVAASDGILRYTVLTPTVLIGGIAATPVYSVLSPQFVSEYQIGVIPAADTPTGDAVSLQIEIGGVTTTNQVTIAVAP